MTMNSEDRALIEHLKEAVRFPNTFLRYSTTKDAIEYLLTLYEGRRSGEGGDMCSSCDGTGLISFGNGQYEDCSCGAAAPGVRDVVVGAESAPKLRCAACNSPRAQSPCHKCGGPLFEPSPSWEDTRLSSVDEVRRLAREVGYGIGVHGSLERDLDLIAAPWVPEAVTPEALADHICKGLDARVVATFHDAPHGRMGFNIQQNGWFKIIDLSVMSPAPPVEAKPAEGVREAIQATIRDKVSGPSFTDPAMKLAHEQDIAIAADAILALLPARDEAAQQFAENAHCSAALPEGWVAAPRHPTHSMKTAGARVCGNYDLAHDAWVQMLAAAPQAHPATGTDELPADVVRLVIAARAVAFDDAFLTADLDANAALKELDAASEAFAARVPWEDEPDDARVPLNEGEVR